MVNAQGLFLVIEGTDGSGKSEQSARLVAQLKLTGRSVLPMDFPRYDDPSSYFVREYLNGTYGDLDEVSPQKASLFFALDRFGASKTIRAAMSEDWIVVANRYVASNMAHQGAKMEGTDERMAFYRWLHETEYETFGIPKPDLNIILHVPAGIAYELVAKKGDREYLKEGKKRDIHESNLPYLKRTEGVYLEIARLFPDEFTVIECVENGTMLSRDEIEKRIWSVVSSRLQ